MDEKDWFLLANSMIDRTDGHKPPEKALVDSIEQLIDEKISMALVNAGLESTSCNPQEAIEYSKLRVEKVINRLNRSV